MTQTISHATEDFLKSQITTRDFRITQLEEHIQKVTQRSYADSADKNRMVEAMKEWTLGELENLSLAQEHAEAIAEIMGFELTTEFEVEVTVLYTITVNALNEEEAQNYKLLIQLPQNLGLGPHVTKITRVFTRH